MPLFRSKKKTDSAKNSTAGVRKSSQTGDALMAGTLNAFDAHKVLLAPRVTEKAALKTEHNVYILRVLPNASKRDISFAVRALYGVSPVKIRTVPIPRKKVRRRQGSGTTSRGKKAYVYLKKGESLNIL